MRAFIFFIGVVCVLAGLAVIYWPVALVCFGLFCVYVSARLGAHPAVSTPDDTK